MAALIMAASREQRTTLCSHDDWFGALAQLGERNTGSVEVSGSIPLGSTNHSDKVGFVSPPEGCIFATLADEVSSAGVFRIFRALRFPAGEVGDV
jgi:hypothetical protein